MSDETKFAAAGTIRPKVVIERTYRAQVEELWDLWTTKTHEAGKALRGAGAASILGGPPILDGFADQFRLPWSGPPGTAPCRSSFDRRLRRLAPMETARSWTARRSTR